MFHFGQFKGDVSVKFFQLKYGASVTFCQHKWWRFCYILIKLISDVSVIFWSIRNLGLVLYYLATEVVSSRNVVLVLSNGDARNVPVNVSDIIHVSPFWILSTFSSHGLPLLHCRIFYHPVPYLHTYIIKLFIVNLRS